MKLKVYDSEGKSRTLGPLSELTFAFDRNTFHARYRAGNGSTVFEDGELHTLFPEGEAPDFMFDAALGNSGSAISFRVGASQSARSSGVGHLVDPTSVPTGGLTDKGKVSEDLPAPVDLKKTQSDELKRVQERIKEINEKNKGEKEQPKSFSVPVASAVGTLVDPGSQDTGKLDKEGNVEVPNAPMNKQGTTKFEINK